MFICFINLWTFFFISARVTSAFTFFPVSRSRLMLSNSPPDCDSEHERREITTHSGRIQLAGSPKKISRSGHPGNSWKVIREDIQSCPFEDVEFHPESRRLQRHYKLYLVDKSKIYFCGFVTWRHEMLNDTAYVIFFLCPKVQFSDVGLTRSFPEFHLIFSLSFACLKRSSYMSTGFEFPGNVPSPRACDCLKFPTDPQFFDLRNKFLYFFSISLSARGLGTSILFPPFHHGPSDFGWIHAWFIVTEVYCETNDANIYVFIGLVDVFNLPIWCRQESGPRSDERKKRTSPHCFRMLFGG